MTMDRWFAGLITASLLTAGCGKLDNVATPPVLQFDNVLPEKPLKLSTTDYKPWASSRAIATRGDDLLVVDSDNGNLVVMDQETLVVTATVPMGTRPEHVLVLSLIHI